MVASQKPKEEEGRGKGSRGRTVGKPERLAEVTPVACSPLHSSPHNSHPNKKMGRGRRASAQHKSRSHEPGATSAEESGKWKRKRQKQAAPPRRDAYKIVRCTTVPDRGNACAKAHGLFVHDVTDMSVSFLFFHPFIACWFLGPVRFAERSWLKVLFTDLL